MNKAVVICGPTASGKSAMALRYALANRGAIINIDACQVYQGTALITDSPTPSDKNLVPHYLYNYLDARAHHCVESHLRAIEVVLEDLQKSNYLPIIVGGSGMYIKALLDGLHYIPPVTSEVKLQTAALFNELGVEKFYQALLELDEQIAGRFSPRDSQRMQRAYAVKMQTGDSIISFYNAEPFKVLQNYSLEVYLLMPDKQTLYERCDQRVAALVKRGALTEVELLLPSWPTLTPAVHKILGIPEFREYLVGNCSYLEALSATQQHTRQYAKRQFTWFRNQLINSKVNLKILNTLQINSQNI